MESLRRWDPDPDVGGATHIGRSHERNEDAIELGRGVRDGLPYTAMVVCDGVSSSSRGDLAAAVAARAAIDLLMTETEGTGELDADHRHHLLRTAVHLAHEAACEAGIEQLEDLDPPGTTLVAALVFDGQVDVAWVGDSRAYLVSPPADDSPGELSILLTHDDSWVNMVVDAGEMPESEARESPLAHAITRCVGPLEDPDPARPAEPSYSHAVVTPGSRLVLCTDGVWGHAASPGDFAGLVGPLVDARSAGVCSAGDLAVELVQRAIAADGEDDLTAAVAFVGGDG